jgi:hypothetical protein
LSIVHRELREVKLSDIALGALRSTANNAAWPVYHRPFHVRYASMWYTTLYATAQQAVGLRHVKEALMMRTDVGIWNVQRELERNKNGKFQNEHITTMYFERLFQLLKAYCVQNVNYD